jgi:uncharacterized DUF497 family protein
MFFGGTNTSVSITFDPEKNAINIAKHGISLARAEDMNMETAVIITDDRFDYGEVQYLAFGDIDGSSHCLVFTLRGNEVRAISLRRANRKEIKRHDL